ncbi:MAG: glutamine amidotransferase [bacterium]
MSNNLQLNLVHLYPEEMNIYGDMGNIIALKQRALWRNIEVNYQVVDKKTSQVDLEKINGDLYFMGGGQDNDMFLVFADLINYKKKFIETEISKNKLFLLICGAFQLFGKFFLDAEGRSIAGLEILPLETKAPGNKLTDRCLGNLASNLSPEVLQEISASYPGQVQETLVGFENHSGQTFFTDNSILPLGKVLVGKGNNNEQLIEGAKFKNVFASYSHGSLLPKNPHLADYLISLALKNKYPEFSKLEKLDDEIEWTAHEKFLKRISSK